jgi:hypothetical protein
VRPEPTSPLVALLEDLGAIIGGAPGFVIRYAARLIREHERFNARVAERIELEKRQMMAAGAAAYEASRQAGRTR